VIPDDAEGFFGSSTAWHGRTLAPRPVFIRNAEHVHQVVQGTGLGEVGIGPQTISLSHVLFQICSLDTAAVQAAIDACHQDQGGTVLVPAGVFVIGTIEMKSNIKLHLAAQGKLLGSADGNQYHAAEAIPLHGDSTLEDGNVGLNVGLIFGVGLQNVVIEGPGTIDGQGAQFRSPARGAPPPAGIGGSHRPYHLLFHQCQNLTVRDIFLTESAFHSVRIIQSKYVKLEGIHIHNRVNHNNDGFHFISSQYVHVSNCDVECQDDACALFGSCKFVTVTNCSFTTRWSVFRFGGGEAENITVSNCLIYGTYGCPIKMRCGPAHGSRTFPSRIW
jgi:polygalacturonase